MDKEKTLLSLNVQIDTLKAHINRLKKSNYKIHLLDVDMLKQKTIELYDTVFELESKILSKGEATVKDVVVEKPLVTKPVVEKTIVREPVIDDVVEEKPLEKTHVEKVEVKKEIPIVVGIPVIEEIPVVEETPIVKKEPVVEEKAVVEEELVIEDVEIVEKKPELEEVVVKEFVPEEKEPEKTEDPVVELIENETTTVPSTYDLFSGSADNALAEKFHKTEEQSIADKMQRIQVVNIREAIGINEKFLFINELFNGDMGRYNKILDDINDLPTKKGVETYLFEIKIQFQWADDNEAYLKLSELISRKFN